MLYQQRTDNFGYKDPKQATFRLFFFICPSIVLFFHSIHYQKVIMDDYIRVNVILVIEGYG